MRDDLLINEPMDKVVMHYAMNAKKAGLAGIVCSPLEAEKVHATCGKVFVTVTPGVRFADGDKGDQVRVMTPAEAKKIGSDYIVVHRSVNGQVHGYPRIYFPVRCRCRSRCRSCEQREECKLWGVQTDCHCLGKLTYRSRSFDISCRTGYQELFRIISTKSAPEIRSAFLIIYHSQNRQ